MKIENVIEKLSSPTLPSNQPKQSHIKNGKDIFPIVIGIIFVVIILGIGVYLYFSKQKLSPQQHTNNTTTPSASISQAQSNQPKEIQKAFTTSIEDRILADQYEIWWVRSNGKKELLYKKPPSYGGSDESSYIDETKRSLDGKKLAVKVSYNTYKGIITANLDVIDIASKTVEQVDQAVFEGEIGGGASTLLDYNWSPNSQDLVYTLHKDSSSSIAKVYNITNKSRTELGVASSPIWINNNKDVVFSNKESVVKINASTKAKSTVDIKLSQFLVPNSTNNAFLAVSENNEMYQLSVDTMTLKSIGTSSEVIQKAGWSPNDKNIAVILRKNDKPSLAILSSSETLSQAKTLDTDLGQLVDHAYGITDDFVWSPDSNYIQFATRVYSLANNNQVKGITMEYLRGGGPHPTAIEVVWSKSSQEVAYYPNEDLTDNWTIYNLNNGTKKVLDRWNILGSLTGDKWLASKYGNIAILDSNGKPLK